MKKKVYVFLFFLILLFGTLQRRQIKWWIIDTFILPYKSPLIIKKVELEPFLKTQIKNETTQAPLSDLHRGKAKLIHIQIKEGKTTFLGPLRYRYHPRTVFFLYFLKEMEKLYFLPDLEFLYALEDSVEEEKRKLPLFCIAKQNNPHVILVPDTEHLHKKLTLLKQIKQASKYSPWKQKIPLAFWRGGTTGEGYPKQTTPRLQLLLFSLANPHLCDAKFTSYQQLSSELKKYIQNSYPHDAPISPQKQIDYRYLIAIDGNSYPSSLLWSLQSNSLVLKCDSEMREWYYKGLIPMKHYVPFKSDFSDLQRIIETLHHNPQQAKAIAEEGSRFISTIFTPEKMGRYCYELFVALSKQQTGYIADKNGVSKK